MAGRLRVGGGPLLIPAGGVRGVGGVGGVRGVRLVELVDSHVVVESMKWTLVCRWWVCRCSHSYL